jgi:elongation factor G
VYSGELKENSRVYCPSKDKKENVAQLWQINASKRERDGQIPKVAAGDIVGVIGPREAVTGDTLCDSKAPIQLESIQFPQTVIEMAIEPETTAERKKLGETLEMLKRQDPTFQAKDNADTGQTLISGMGELHLEIIKNRLLRDFNLNVKVHKPRVSYRETISHAVVSTGECHRQVAGQNLFAKITIRMEPVEEAGAGVQVLNLAASAMPPSLSDAAIEELKGRGQGGGAIGSFPLAKLRVTLLSAELNEQSNETAVTIAAGDAFERGLRQAGPVLLEPIMRLTITTPDDFYGDFLGDLAQRRAKIIHTDSHDSLTVIEAHAPLAELFGYSNAMRSLSQGRAGTSLEPLEYAPAPAEVAASFGV